MSQQDRFTKVEYEEADPELKAIYDDTMVTMGIPFVLNWFKYQGNNRRLLAGNWAKVKSTLCEGDVPLLLKQIILFNISKERGCTYCTLIHGTTANMMGEELCDLPSFKLTDDLNSVYIPSSYKTAVRVVTECALDPLNIPETAFEDLRDEGFSELEIQELMAQADLSVTLSYEDDGREIELVGLSPRGKDLESRLRHQGQ